MAAGVKAGDLVMTVPNTFIATTEAISQAGASRCSWTSTSSTYNMDPRASCAAFCDECLRDAAGKLAVASPSARTRRSRRSCRCISTARWRTWTRILELAAQYSLMMVEDACQAHGAEVFLAAKENAGTKAGSMGKAAAFSFYPGKNLGACGEAGAVTTNDAELAAKRSACCAITARRKKYYHDVEGYNGRLDAIQAACCASSWSAWRNGTSSAAITPKPIANCSKAWPEWCCRTALQG